MSKQNREQNRRERAAAIRAEQARRERNKRLGIGGVVVAVLAVIVVVGVMVSSQGSGGEAAQPLPKNLEVQAASSSMVVGNNPDAKVKVTVYEDFLCPFCRQFESASRNFLHADAAKGKVQVDYRPFQLLQDDYSKRALNAWGVVLREGTPRQALKFHDLLYENQPYENDSSKPSVSDLESLAKKAGVTDPKVLAAFGTGSPGFYDAAMKAANDANVQGTPTVLVNGKQVPGTTDDAIISDLKKDIAGS